MKILLILLGCLAFANAGCYHPYYRTASCRIFPQRHCYTFKSFGCRAWYTCGYYSDVVKVYPDSDCTIKEDTVVVSDAETALEGKRDEIKTELDDDKLKWDGDLDDYTQDAKDAASKCYTDYYQKLIDAEDDAAKITELEGKRDAKIGEFNDDADEKAKKAKDAYQKCIDDTMERIKDFHDDMISRLTDCLATRAEKITEYNDALDERVTDYKDAYRKALEDNLEKRKEAMKTVLLRCAPDDEALVDAVVALLSYEKSIDDMVQEYSDEISPKVEDLKTYYKCNYRCATGCLSFSKRSYYSHCARLGNWWSYRCVYTVPCSRSVKYTYTWKPCEYTGLKDCDPLEENKTKDALSEEMKGKVQDKYDDAVEALEKWVADWEGIHAKYVVKYKEIIEDRHEAEITCLERRYKCDDGVIDDDEQAIIDAKKTELAGKVDDLVDTYEQDLKDKRDKAETDAKEALDDWKLKADEAIDELLGKYQECLDAFAEKKTDYEGKVDDWIAERRECLEANLQKVVDKNYEGAENTVEAWLGDDKMTETAVTDYLAKVKEILDEEKRVVLEDEFDVHMAEVKTELVAHYYCQLRCCAPTYCARSYVTPRCYGWRVCYPTAYCYRYHVRYYISHFYHHTFGGHYYC